MNKPATQNNSTIFIRVDNDGHYKTMTAYLMEIRDGDLYSPGFNDGDLDRVNLYAQTDRDVLSRSDTTYRSAMYGAEVNYQQRGIGMKQRELEKALKIVKTVNARMAKIEKLAGPAASFGATIQRFGKAVGAAHVTMVRSARGQEMTGEKYETRIIEDSCGFVDNKICNWIDEHQPKTSVA